jgi:adenylate cyclase
MFTDVVGYTALGQRDESLSLAVVDAQQNLLRPVLRRHGGREVKTMGDAFMVEFSSAVEAVRCGYDVQRSVREFNLSLPSDKRLHIRIGVHLGEVVERQGDIFGDAVNVASRIESLAEDGGVCLTQQVYDQVQNKLDLQLVTMGKMSLKNVTEPIELFRMVMPWTGDDSTDESGLDTTRLAILPLASISPDPNDEYFADGMTDELISTTSSIAGLTLIARTSVMGYKKTNKKVGEIGRELSVGTVLEGSVRKAGTRLRITLQLIDVQSQGHLWAQSYDRNLEDVFAIQCDVAKKVADALRVRILPTENHRIEKRPTESTDAHTFYLKGRYYWNERKKESLLKAIEYFRLAIVKDPEYALAYSGIADCYAVLGNHRYISFLEAFSQAKENALKAVQCDDSSVESHTSLALSLFHVDYDWEGAEKEFKRAIELNPNYATAHQWYAILLWLKGKLGESLREALWAERLDPLTLQIPAFCTIVYDAMGKYDKAEDCAKRVFESDPDFIPGHVNLRWVYLHQGKYDLAEDETRKVLELTNNDPGEKAYLAAVYAFAGRTSEAEGILEEVNKERETHYVPNFALILTYLGLGEKEKAIVLIEDEYEGRADWLPQLAVDPLYESVRSDPRVVEILRKIGL